MATKKEQQNDESKKEEEVKVEAVEKASMEEKKDDPTKKDDALAIQPKQDLVAKQEMPLAKVDKDAQEDSEVIDKEDAKSKDGDNGRLTLENDVASDNDIKLPSEQKDPMPAESGVEQSEKGIKTSSKKGPGRSGSQPVVIKPRKRGKKYKESRALIEDDRAYSLTDAIDLIKKVSYAKFDATVEFHARLGVDPKKPDQMVRGSITLPHGTGKTVSVLVFAQGDKISEAKEAGADFVGLDDLMEKISGGWLDFDIVVATPDVMAKIAKLGKILGTRGLMPNPKAGTVTFDVAKIVKDLKAGRIEFKLEKLPLIHSKIGKVSFSEEQLMDNAKTLIAAIIKAKPSSAKGVYLQSAYLNATMSPSIKLDVQQLRNL